MTDIENEYAGLSVFLKDNDVNILKDSNMDVYNIIQNVFEKTNPNTAFYIINLGDIIRQVKYWHCLFPYIEPRYAVKCNPNKVICQLLGLLGVGFDVASKNEISLVKDCVNNKEQIIYANPYKESSSVQYARSEDIDISVFDSVYELYKMRLYHPNCKLLLRLKVNDDGSLCQFSKKFGVESNEVEELLKTAKELNLNIIGVCFHVGSGCTDAKLYYEALKMCKNVFALAKTYKFDLSVIDIGGGFYGLRTPETDEMMTKIKNNIEKGLTELFNEYHIENFDENFSLPKLQLLSEPGRFFVQSSHTLMVNIIGKKVRHVMINKDADDNTKSKKRKLSFENDVDDSDDDHCEIKSNKIYYYYINDGVYGSFNCIYFDHQHPKILPYNERDGELYDSVIFGPTCDSLDEVCNKTKLPELEIGEWCYVSNFGAYTVAASTNFNGFSKLKAFYIIN